MHFLRDTPAHDLTYSDVFMVPSRSSVTSRLAVDLSTRDGLGTTLPLVVSNMTAVSGRRMSETVARRGGIAILPQDIPVHAVQETIHAVKASHPVFESAVTIGPDEPVSAVLALMGKRAHRAAVVVEGTRPVGIVAEAQCLQVDRFTTVGQVMSDDLLTVAADADLRETFDLLVRAHLDLAPVVDADGSLLGVITRKGILRSTIYSPALDRDGRLSLGVAIGINGDVREKAATMLSSGA
ncbi:MAG: IMP dehydrogenase, partial [Actinomycetota bacterium]|nr:IMP dehydrogenase [Actinomycetota bacterium]